MTCRLTEESFPSTKLSFELNLDLDNALDFNLSIFLSATMNYTFLKLSKDTLFCVGLFFVIFALSLAGR